MLVQESGYTRGGIKRGRIGRYPPGSVWAVGDGGENEWNAPALGSHRGQPIAAGLNDLIVEVANLVQYLQCMLQRNRLAVASTQVRLERVPEAAVAVLIRTQRGKHLSPVSMIEEEGKAVTVEQPSAAEDEASCGCEIHGPFTA